MTYRSPLHIRAATGEAEYVRITPERAKWQHLSFAARLLNRGEVWEGRTEDFEYGFVILGGTCRVESSKGKWSSIGRRPNVFAGMPYGLFLPPHTSFHFQATSEQLDLCYGWCLGGGSHPARLVTPESVAIEIRGGGNATRQINSIFPPGFDCERLVAVEVYTPSGNWSSYPPHKHDIHRVDPAGQLLEADLEEVYFYKIDPPQGYAVQRVYTADSSMDETITARNNDAVLIPEGYHPVASAAGYTTYYLNFLSGSAQSLANTDDPAHAWVKDTWHEKDPRVPLVSMKLEQG